ncbi:hypothetical protein ACFPRL_30630 [Pseudoclavibacter helvolus]
MWRPMHAPRSWRSARNRLRSPRESPTPTRKQSACGAAAEEWASDSRAGCPCCHSCTCQQ